MRLKFDELLPQLQDFCTSTGFAPTLRALKGKLEEGFNERREDWLSELDRVLPDLRQLRSGPNSDTETLLSIEDRDELSEWALGFEPSKNNDPPEDKDHHISVEPNVLRIHWGQSPMIKAEYGITAILPKQRRSKKESKSHIDGPIKVDWRSRYTCQWPLNILGPGHSVSDLGGYKGKESTHDQVSSQSTEPDQSGKTLPPSVSDLDTLSPTSRGDTASQISGDTSSRV
jgi:hypothetical protein